ncbi:MAG: lipoyl(octanoyl) transferase LipB, partial [Sphingomonadaceae bacterium]
MEARAEAVRAGTAPELVWLLEHPPLYTAGTSAREDELLAPGALPVFRTGRGGRWTWHGPGQRIAYLVLDLQARRLGVHDFVARIEAWVVAALARLGVAAGTVPGKTGVWVDGAKIAAIGVRVRRWVSFHGVAINVAPDLAHYAGIVPCGLSDPVTSLERLGSRADMGQVDEALRACFSAAWDTRAESAAPQPFRLESVAVRQ